MARGRLFTDLALVLAILSYWVPNECRAEPPHSPAALSPEKILDSIKIPGNITIRYQMTDRDTRTPAMIEDSISQNKQGYENMYKNKTITRAQADQYISGLSATLGTKLPDRTAIVTLSVAGNRLLYGIKGDKGSDVFIYDGASTVRIQKGPGSYIIDNSVNDFVDKSKNKSPKIQMYVYKGFAFSHMRGFPLCGISTSVLPIISGLPLVKSRQPDRVELSAESPVCDGSASDHAQFEPSSVVLSVNSSGTKILNCSNVFTDGTMLDQWQYDNHVPFGSNWVPKHMLFARYVQHPAGSPILTGADYSCEYSLISVNNKALEDDSYKWQTYMHKGDAVIDMQQSAYLPTQYVPNSSLADLHKNALVGQQKIRQNIMEGNVGGNRTAGICLLAAIALFTISACVRNSSHVKRIIS